MNEGNMLAAHMDTIGQQTSEITIKRMQEYLNTKGHDLTNNIKYFHKLLEEVGELAEVVCSNSRMNDNLFKGTIEEEISDVLYYVVLLANTYDIDLEYCFRKKEQINAIRYNHKLKYTL